MDTLGSPGECGIGITAGLKGAADPKVARCRVLRLVKPQPGQASLRFRPLLRSGIEGEIGLIGPDRRLLLSRLFVANGQSQRRIISQRAGGIKAGEHGIVLAGADGILEDGAHDGCALHEDEIAEGGQLLEKPA